MLLSRLRRLAPCTFVLCASLGAQPVAEPPIEPVNHTRTFTSYFENDIFTGTDENYTNGVKLSWLTSDLTSWGQTGWRQRLLDHLPFINRPGTQKKLGFGLGQNIYTPADIARRNPDPADRPYAGWSYLELTFVSKTASRADIISLQAGIVGPSSGAAVIQRKVHQLVETHDPRGWAYQLRDEPGFNFIYERRHRLVTRRLGDRLDLDFIPHGGFSLGNVQSHATLGGTGRLGFNLPSDFGVGLARGGSIAASSAAEVDDAHPPASARPTPGFFLFAGGEGRAIARDIFLDGNTWKAGRSVDREKFVADLMAGFGLTAGRWQLTGTVAQRSREFITQADSWSRFGSLTLSVAF